MARRPALLLLAAMLGGPALAAELAPADQAELKRGVAAVGYGTSEEPALRRERLTREPTAGFQLGTALQAWINAAESLDYRLHYPSGDGDDTEAIAIDCFDEKTAMTRLESRRQALGLTPEQVTAGSGIAVATVAAAWKARLASPPACR